MLTLVFSYLGTQFFLTEDHQLLFYIHGVHLQCKLEQRASDRFKEVMVLKC